MKKKFIATVVAAILSASTRLLATGLGPQINFDWGYAINPKSGISGAFDYTTNFALSAKFDSLPIYWAFSFGFGPVTVYDTIDMFNVPISSNVNAYLIRLATTADYWVMNPQIVNLWHWYWGFGGFASMGFTTKGGNIYLDIGPRALIGFNWYFIDGAIELFAQQVFQPMMRFVFGKEGTNNGIFCIPLHFPIEIGCRFYF